jgi:hypothetical protein
MDQHMRLLPDTLSTGTTGAPPSPTDHSAYRQALGTFGTGVTVVTARWQDQDWGMTCNSFSSVSLEPRLVLWSIRREANSYEAFTRSGGFTVNCPKPRSHWHASSPPAALSSALLAYHWIGLPANVYAFQALRPGSTANCTS